MTKKFRNKKELKLFSWILALTFSFFYLFDFSRNKSTFFMPKEYKEIKNLVNKLAAKNNLGDRKILFSINNADYISWNMKDLELCKEKMCWYYKNLNPYKKYKDRNGINLNELTNQAYLYGGIEAYAWNDIVWISKSTFRSIRENNGFLGCIIAHEISHILFDDHIKDSLSLSSKLSDLGVLKNKKPNKKDLEDKEKKLLEMEISRYSEIQADISAAELLINAGFPKDTCSKFLTYMTGFEKLEIDTDPNSSHPGYLERYSSLKKFISLYEIKSNLKVNKNNKWKWSFNRELNVLTFIPKNK